MMIEIDTLGQSCPLPLLMLKKALKQSNNPDDIWLLKSSDAHSRIDICRYCEIHQLSCELTEVSAQEFHFRISRPSRT